VAKWFKEKDLSLALALLAGMSSLGKVLGYWILPLVIEDYSTITYPFFITAITGTIGFCASFTMCTLE